MAAEARPGIGRRVKAAVLGLVPGLAHVLVLDRPGVGTAYFLIFMAGVDAVVAARWLLDVDWAADLLLAGIAVAGLVWLVAFLDMARLAFFRDYEKRAEERRTLAGRGVRAYAAGRLGEARTAFRACLALDARDADALFWYGCIEARRGKRRRARRAFRRCVRHDLDGKWAWQTGVELERLESGA